MFSFARIRGRKKLSCYEIASDSLSLCSLQDWFKYALTRLKMRYIQKLRIEHAKLKEELVQLKCIDFKKAKDNLLIRKVKYLSFRKETLIMDLRKNY